MGQPFIWQPGVSSITVPKAEIRDSGRVVGNLSFTGLRKGLSMTREDSQKLHKTCQQQSRAKPKRIGKADLGHDEALVSVPRNGKAGCQRR
jgi:hypothetical protein